MAKYVELMDGTKLKTTSKKALALVVKDTEDGEWRIFSYHNRVDLAERQVELHGLLSAGSRTGVWKVEIAPVA